MPRKALLLLALLVGAFSIPVLAAAQRVAFDPAASEVSFTLGTTLHVVHGTLPLAISAIDFDLESGVASGKLVIDAKGAETGNRKRDRKMHEEVLETQLYPAIVFRAEGVSGRLDEKGEGDVTLVGTLDIHGESRPFELHAHVTREGESVLARCEFEIPYVEWGMKDPSLFLIRAKKVVDVVVEARGAITTQEPSSGSEP